MTAASQLAREDDGGARGAPAGLVLAAGEGRRFGGPKAAVRLGGRTLLQRSVDLLTCGGCQPVIVVLGAQHVAVAQDADLAHGIVVVNDDWRTGMASSLLAGLRTAEEVGAQAVTVVLVDQPMLGAEAVRRVGAAWAAGATVAVATYGGRNGHPVTLDHSTWDDVRAAAEGDAGARRLIDRRPELVTTVACDGTGDPGDVDTPGDLARNVYC